METKIDVLKPVFPFYAHTAPINAIAKRSDIPEGFNKVKINDYLYVYEPTFDVGEYIAGKRKDDIQKGLVGFFVQGKHRERSYTATIERGIVVHVAVSSRDPFFSWLFNRLGFHSGDTSEALKNYLNEKLGKTKFV